MSNNKQQVSHWYNGYQICLYPDTCNQKVLVWGKDGEIVYTNYFIYVGIVWSDVDTQEKMLAYVKKAIDNLTTQDLRDLATKALH